VWTRLAELEFGHAISYGELGQATGRPSAGRAVGGAVGANPVPIIVPCHRVLASNKRITGYSGGNGIPTKMWLLKHEGIEARA
jgi:methylated-DNA-[protein]-cysteine S-methyltransferase